MGTNAILTLARAKTSIRSTMKYSRLNHLLMIHICKEELEKTDMKLTTNELTKVKYSRIANFEFYQFRAFVCFSSFTIVAEPISFYSHPLPPEIIRKSEGFQVISGSIERNTFERNGLIYHEMPSIKYVRNSTPLFGSPSTLVQSACFWATLSAHARCVHKIFLPSTTLPTITTTTT